MLGVTTDGSCDIAILEHIADAEGISVFELPPLYDSIDPEHLNTLLGSEDTIIQFEYYGYEITVSGDGTLYLKKSEDLMS